MALSRWATRYQTAASGPRHDLRSATPARFDRAPGEWFTIDHVTLELECDKCKSGNNVCLE